MSSDRVSDRVSLSRIMSFVPRSCRDRVRVAFESHFVDIARAGCAMSEKGVGGK